MSMVFTQTTVLPVSKQNVRPTLLVMNIISGSVDIQYPCADQWVSSGTIYTSSAPRAMENFGVPVRVVITGNVTCEYTDSTVDR
jgi:hypothetical protein